MKIRMLRNASASYGCTLHEGETGDVDPVLGRSLVDAKIAESLDPAPPTQPILAVPEPPAIAADPQSPTKGRKRAPPPISTYDDA